MNSNLNNFTAWMKNEGFYLSPKIDIVYGIQSNYGVIANKHIDSDEVLFKIPRTSILSTHNSEICDELVRENVVQNSKWGSLILCLFHELFLGEKSQYFHYLKMFPNFDNLKLPMFWNTDELLLLRGTGVEETLNKDMGLLKNDFETCVLPFIKKYPHFFNEGICLEKFKHYVAFVMAYSFTKKEDEVDESEDDSEGEDQTVPYLVPMADVLNHAAKNNAELIYSETELTMVAVEAIEAGTEVLNTYGALPNSQLLQQYGFCLTAEDNVDDVIEMNVANIPRSLCLPMIADRFEAMSKFSQVVLCKTGFLNTYELAMCLHFLHSDEVEFKSWIDNVKPEDPWEEADEDVEMMADNLIEFETMEKLPKPWRSVLGALISHTIAEKQAALVKLTLWGDVANGQTSPINFVRRLLLGHLNLLETASRFL